MTPRRAFLHHVRAHFSRFDAPPREHDSVRGSGDHVLIGNRSALTITPGPRVYAAGERDHIGHPGVPAGDNHRLRPPLHENCRAYTWSLRIVDRLCAHLVREFTP